MNVASRRQTVVRLSGFARPYWLGFAAATTLAVSGTAAGLLIPLGLREMVDSATSASDVRALDRLAMGLIGLFAVHTTIQLVGRYVLNITAERVTADLRRRLFGHLISLPLSYFNRARIGDLTSRLTSDVSAVRTAISAVCVDAVATGAGLLGAVALVLFLNWRLGLIILLTVPVAAAAAHVFSKTLWRAAREVQDRLAEMSAIAEEVLGAVTTVRLFSREAHEADRYGVAVDHWYKASRSKVVISVVLSAVVSFLFAILIALLFWYGGREVVRGRLTLGELVALLIYSITVSNGTRGILDAFTSFSTAAGASARLFEILDVPAPTPVRGTRRLLAARGSLAFHRVAFCYSPGAPVLRDLEFVVRPGEKVAIVGSSGAGKSTLLGLISRLYDPTQGSILLDGHDLRTLALDSLRRHIAVVSQEPVLFNASIADNIRYGRLGATDLEVRAAARAANAEEFIIQLPQSYDTRVGERAVLLSGGQRQRIAIARALLKDAPVLLLDEATASLDGENESAVLQALAQLMEGRTVVLVGHRLSTFQKMDRILVLSCGTIAEEGDHTALLRRQGLYWRLVSSQIAQSPDIGMARHQAVRAAPVLDASL